MAVEQLPGVRVRVLVEELDQCLLPVLLVDVLAPLAQQLNVKLDERVNSWLLLLKGLEAAETM